MLYTLLRNTGDTLMKEIHFSFDDDNENNVYSYGNTDSQQAHNLFSMLRSLDDKGAEKIYVRMPQKNGVGLAVYNRLVRAAGFEVISL